MNDHHYHTGRRTVKRDTEKIAYKIGFWIMFAIAIAQLVAICYLITHN